MSDFSFASSSESANKEPLPRRAGSGSVRDIISVVSAISNTLLSLGKISAQQAGEALVVASKYLEGN